MKWLKLFLGLLNAVALASFAFATTGWVAVRWWPWLAGFQLGPAILAADAFVLVALVLIALLRGRFYCETLCPLGIVQDVIRLITFKRVRRVCSRLPELKAQRFVRWVILLLVVVSIVAAYFTAAPSLAPWLDPYAIYMRAVSWKGQPNPSFLVTVFSFAGIVIVAILAGLGKGRIWCNWICPLGTILHCFSKISQNQDHYEKCAHCDRCRKCFMKEVKNG